MKKSFIFGVNGVSEVLLHHLSNEGLKVENFILNSKYITKEVRDSMSLPVVSIEQVLAQYGAKNIAVYVMVGYTKMNNIRENVFRQLDEHCVEILSYYHPSSTIAPNASLGRGNIIFEHVTVQPYVCIGSGNIINAGSTISHHTHIGDFNWFAPSVVTAGRVSIQDKCFLGCNCTVKNGVVIQNEALIGAGAYVYKSIPQGAVFVPQRGHILDKRSNEIVID